MLAVAVAVAIAVWPAGAHAASVRLMYLPPLPKAQGGGYSLLLTAAPGEVNDVSLARTSDAISARDAGAPLAAMGGCSGVDDREAACPLPEGVPVQVRVELGDNDDVARLANLHAVPVGAVLGGAGSDTLSTAEDRVMLEGGAGQDTLIGGAGSDPLFGGADADVLIGGPGDDHLMGEAPSGTTAGADAPDRLEGGPGVDLASYASRSTAVTVDLANTGPQPDADTAMNAGRAARWPCPRERVARVADRDLPVFVAPT